MASKPVSEGRRNAFTALAFITLALAPMTAKADSIFNQFTPQADPYVVQNNVARWGFVPHGAMTRRGDVYLYDVSDRNGVSQRLIIDAHSGRILERYVLRPPAWADAGPRDDAGGWAYPPHPQVEAPVVRPKFVDLFPEDDPPVVIHIPHQHLLAYGEGHVATPTPEVVKPPEKPKPRLVRPKAIPLPAASDQPQTATAAPSASEPAVQPPTTTLPQAAPASTQVAPAPREPAPAPAAAESAPAPTGVVASSGTVDAPAAKAPQPAPAPLPATKGKAINDIPVAPLD